MSDLAREEMAEEDIIELASICGISYFNTPVGTSEMHCYEHNLISFAEKLMNTRPITPLQEAERAFIEAYRTWHYAEGSAKMDAALVMGGAWNHLQQIEEQSNG
jgi:hypothetical protein